MGRFNAKKVATPGTQILKRLRGRPQKKKNNKSKERGKYMDRYSLEELEEAMRLVKANKKTIRDASKEFNIPASTLSDKIKGKCPKSVGRQTVLSMTEEKVIAEKMLVMGDWGFPLRPLDVKMLVREFLNEKGFTTRFGPDNMPGKDWMMGFLNRHPEISKRRANLLKRSRASVGPEEVKSFFQHFSVVADGVPPENMWNYDETNFTEDPRVQECFFRRGTKYAEKVCDNSKNAISVMFCGSASGVLLPPYIVYRAANVWTGWTNGYPGAVFSATESGWFTFFTFEDWFRQIFLPYRRRLTGKVVLIGDNLRTHLSLDVIQLCREENIEFVCLPPNITDKMQPLDVAVFRGMKEKWREIVREMRVADPGLKALDKKDFPENLKELVKRCDVGKNLQSGFAKSGLYPLNEEKVLARLPRASVRADVMGEIVESKLAKGLKIRR